MKNKGNFYTYNKFLGIAIILIMVIFYLAFYFYPTLKNIKDKKKKLTANISQIDSFKKEVEKFQPPDEKEKLLWQKIEKLSDKIYVKIEKKADFLKYVNSILYKLNNVLSSEYDDFLVNINNKNIKLTQTYKQDSDLISEFKTINESSSLSTGTENATIKTFKAFDTIEENKSNKEDSEFRIKIFTVSTLKKSSVLLINLYKELKNFSLERIVIKRRNNKTYYLFILNFRVKRLYKDAKK